MPSFKEVILFWELLEGIIFQIAIAMLEAIFSEIGHEFLPTKINIHYEYFGRRKGV